MGLRKGGYFDLEFDRLGLYGRVVFYVPLVFEYPSYDGRFVRSKGDLRRTFGSVLAHLDLLRFGLESTYGGFFAVTSVNVRGLSWARWFQIAVISDGRVRIVESLRVAIFMRVVGSTFEVYVLFWLGRGPGTYPIHFVASFNSTFSFPIRSRFVGLLCRVNFVRFVEGFDCSGLLFTSTRVFRFNLSTSGGFSSSYFVDFFGSVSSLSSTSDERVESFGVLRRVVSEAVQLVRPWGGPVGGFVWVVEQGVHYVSDEGAY